MQSKRADKIPQPGSNYLCGKKDDQGEAIDLVYEAYSRPRQGRVQLCRPCIYDP